MLNRSLNGAFVVNSMAQPVRSEDVWGLTIWAFVPAHFEPITDFQQLVWFLELVGCHFFIHDGPKTAEKGCYSVRTAAPVNCYSIHSLLLKKRNKSNLY